MWGLSTDPVLAHSRFQSQAIFPQRRYPGDPRASELEQRVMTGVSELELDACPYVLGGLSRADPPRTIGTA